MHFFNEFQIMYKLFNFTENQDFIPSVTQLNISGNGSSFQIPLPPDDLIEATELFIVRLHILCEPLVQIGLGEVNVTILDNTSIKLVNF